MNIIVDAMGGDNAPQAIIEGCIAALLEKQGFSITLVGKSDAIQEVLNKKEFDKSRIKVVNATEVITGEDTPTKAIRGKKDSSMVVGLKLLKEKNGDVFISAGNTGALLTGALLIVGRIKGVDRPTMPALIPSKKGLFLLVDAGMNTVCKPINYLQFGIMGSIYMKNLFNIDPKVGLVNVGSEEAKGNDNIKQAYALLSDSELNFIGNLEGNNLPEGKADVAVCDGFVGNVSLKLIEGCGSFFLNEIKEIFTKNIISKICYLLLKNGLRAFKRKVDPDEYAGAPVLGVKGLVIKSHGSSTARTIKNVILKRAYTLVESNVIDQITDKFNTMEVKTTDDEDDS